VSESLQSLQIAPEEAAAPPKAANKKKFASKMRSIVSAVKTAQRLEVTGGKVYPVTGCIPVMTKWHSAGCIPALVYPCLGVSLSVPDAFDRQGCTASSQSCMMHPAGNGSWREGGGTLHFSRKDKEEKVKGSVGGKGGGK
jgi:hypothetical protein